jgi:predicted GNAT family acetyltransferase
LSIDPVLIQCLSGRHFRLEWRDACEFVDRTPHAPDAPLRFFAIRRNGKAVAAWMLYLADGLAGICCVVTREEERGKGFGAHVTAEPLRAARRLGYRVGELQSSPATSAAVNAMTMRDIK